MDAAESALISYGKNTLLFDSGKRGSGPYDIDIITDSYVQNLELGNADQIINKSKQNPNYVYMRRNG
ncbi:hypothetical protein DP091_05910 [Paenibacillus sp. MDMC362]|nr:hypothetical protein DP091_05910 [Paenibacillus sp. MDMC362]